MPPSEHRRAYMREYLRLRRARERSGMEPRVGKGVVPAITGIDRLPRTPEAEARRTQRRREPLERFLVGSEGQLLPEPRPRIRKDPGVDGPRTIRKNGRRLRNCRPDPSSRWVKEVLKGRRTCASRSEKFHLKAMDYEHTGATLCGIVIDPSRLLRDYQQDQICGSCEKVVRASANRRDVPVEIERLRQARELSTGEISYVACVLVDGTLAGTRLRFARLALSTPPHPKYFGESQTVKMPPARVGIIDDTGETRWYWRKNLRDPRREAEAFGAIAYWEGTKSTPPTCVLAIEAL